MAKKKNAQGRPPVKARRVSKGFTMKPSVFAMLSRVAAKRGMTRSALVEQILMVNLPRWDTTGNIR